MVFNQYYYWKSDQVKRLLRALNDIGYSETWMAALLMWRVRLRISEAVALGWDQVEFTTEMPVLFACSSDFRDVRVVPLHPELVELFKDPGRSRTGSRVVGVSARTVSRQLRDGFLRLGWIVSHSGLEGVFLVLPVSVIRRPCTG